MVVVVVMPVGSHMIHGAAVALAKCVAIIIAQAVLYWRMTIHLVIVSVLVAAFCVVPACRFNSVVEP